ncbi:TPA_asm: N [Asclepias syriaca virus 1]|uniref:Nucleoprotein n=1 Tax=Asclepias syriaca virus 1 TaxID=2793722 RepID=A0A8D9PGZ0_9RHAB|nr:N [Asclepias syriaca virus 1] [Asclepias syriaca virus 1]DAF42284.1 TPA_asm: N [Asclepias syriaca virus 1]
MADKAARLEEIRKKLNAGASSSKPVQPVKQQESKYGDLDSVKVTLNNAPKVWNDKDLKSIKIYEVSQLSRDDILRLGNHVFNSIAEGTFTTSDVDIILALAVSLLEPGCDSNNPVYILEPLPEGYGNAFKDVNIARSEARAESLSEAANTLNRLREQHSTAEGESKKKLAGVISRLEARVASEETQTDLPVSNAEDVFIFPYAAAYMMRLYGKTPDVWSEKIELAKRRAATWYDMSEENMEIFSVTSEQAMIIRESMSRKPEIVSTWVMWCAYAENNSSRLAQSSFGMLKYLANQMFAYTAMHAYSFVIQIQAETGVSFKLLLTELDCPATRAGVREIANIIRTYELTEAHPNRKTYFRYARVWDSGYFSSIQTSNCKMLAYVVAKVRKSLSTQGMSNPTDIYALKSLDSKLMGTLDVVADNLYDMIIRNTTEDEESGSIWKKRE